MAFVQIGALEIEITSDAKYVTYTPNSSYSSYIRLYMTTVEPKLRELGSSRTSIENDVGLSTYDRFVTFFQVADNPRSNYKVIVPITIRGDSTQSYPNWTFHIKYVDATGTYTDYVIRYANGGSITIPVYEMPTSLSSSYTVSIVNGGNLTSASMDSTTKTSFPATFTVSANKTITVTGKADPVVTIASGGNVESVTVDGTAHTSFPFTNTVSGSKTLTVTGKTQPTLGVNMIT